jgi:hypothetical protein
MKFCPVVPEICRGQVHGPRKEWRRKRKRRIIIITRYDYNLTIKSYFEGFKGGGGYYRILWES